MRRARLSTVLLLIVILALALALVLQHRRAAERETQLRIALVAVRDQSTGAILAGLQKPIDLPFADGTTLDMVVQVIKLQTRNDLLPAGIPIYLDPVGLHEAGATMKSPVTIDATGLPIKVALDRVLKPLKLGYFVKDGLLTITSTEAVERPPEQAGILGP